MPGSIGKPATICVIGSINMDLVIRTPRFAKPGETLTAQSWTSVPGGKGANQAVAAARLEANVRFCGRVGSDAFGHSLRANLISERIDASHLSECADHSSGVALITVDDAGQNTIYVVGGANHAVSVDDIRLWKPIIGSAAYVLLQLEIPLEATLAAIEVAASLSVPVLLDPAPAPAAGFPESMLKVDLLSPNESETEALTGITLTDLHRAKGAALDLRARGAKRVVIKLGSRGALAINAEGTASHVMAAPVDVVDTTAAGDAFSAALAFSLARGESLEAATQFACAAGAFAVGKTGAQPSMPTCEEIATLRKLHEFRISSL
jgi:ribokinase